MQLPKLYGQWEWAVLYQNINYKLIDEEYIFNLNLLNNLFSNMNDRAYDTTNMLTCGFDAVKLIREDSKEF